MADRSDRIVLVTGASGFIGARLVRNLLDRGYRVRCALRRPAPLPTGAEPVMADLLRPETLHAALRGVDTAYYLVHSMGAGHSRFAEQDRRAAGNFVEAANVCGLRRAIYLGGLGETGDNLSHHLASRLEVADILRSGRFATTFLRAAVIIGAGGASYEMVRALVRRLPVMITPRWVTTRNQPIAVADVIGYLAGCLEEERTTGGTFDIGGPDIMTYREMMERFAHLMGRRLLIIPVPVLSPRLSSYWVGLVTPVQPSIAIALIEGLKNEVICRENRIRELLPIPLTPYDDAIKTALAENRQYGGS
ncbi:NAD(P)H-binding protein [Trichlorobacter ammonificans]|uniref:NAD-dependent epimerase/dehydratase n=1 Tax=Trichlorobacter ammonificans TaxID=2916410 RepID=A0ABN8HMQ9_9BACT|nr:NAD(P)H-binding protein [Trichlorobacter ammonificans]CAH2032263.1 NAD-dependent epimerase/dehydratase [Trichlorobacter ammonificans]